MAAAAWTAPAPGQRIVVGGTRVLLGCRACKQTIDLGRAAWVGETVDQVPGQPYINCPSCGSRVSTGARL